VTLTVSDGSLSDSYEQTISVQEVNDTPVADFTYSVSGLTASFIDQSMDEENGVSTWNWDFGEGSSDVQNPSYTFSSPGEKTVTLTVTDSGGATSEPVSNSFMVYAPPVAGNGGAISVVSISESSISVSWDSATDADDNPSDLTYTVYYSSRLTDLQGTLSEIQARASIGPSGQAVDQGVISYLDPNTQYYFTVVVQDPGGLYDAYTISNATTLINSSFIIAGDFSSYNGTRSIFVARYEITNEQIRLVSSGVYDTLENDYAEDVTVDGSGNVFVVGYRHNGTDEDALIVRFTSALGMPSGVSFDVRDDDRFNSVEYSGSYVYAAGIGAFNGTTSQGIVYQIEPLSLSVAASINGLNIMGQSSEMQICEWIQADSIGNLFVCGYENAGEGDQWVVWKISSEFKEINEHNFGDIGITGRAQAGDIRNDLWYAAGTYPDNTGAGAVSPVNFLTGYMDPGLIVSDVFASTEETEVTGICIDEFGGLVVTGCLGNLSTTWTASIVHPDTLSSLDLSQFNSSTLYGSPEDALSIDAERTIIIGPETSLSTVRSCIILLDNSGSSTVLSVPIGDVINMGQYETGSGNGLFMRALCKE
ncbi:MAG: PKD domain-containing protein, partial [Spirochaetia bacterium]